MKILVLGGTGAMGVHLVDILSKRCDEVFVTSRRARSSRENVTFVQGNAHDDVFLKSLLEGHRWDAIVDFMIYSTDEFRKRISLLLGATAQYVFLSSSRVYADSPTPITETSLRLLDVSQDKTYLATDEYALTKARQENILRTENLARNWTIIRPYITYSEIRLQLGVWEKEVWLYRALHGQTLVFSKDIAEKMTTLTYGYDVARGIVALLGNDTALGETFHITCDRPIRWQDVLGIYLDVLESKTGNRPKVFILDKTPIMTPQAEYDRFYNRIFDNTKINGFIDTTTFFESKQGLQRMLETFLENPRFDRIPGKVMAAIDCLTGERTSLAAFIDGKEKASYVLFRYCPLVAWVIERLYRKIHHRNLS